MTVHKPTNIGIEITDLSKNFVKTKALDSITLSLGSGLLHGLIGPEGAGKTTLLRLLAGLLRPSSGTFKYLDDGKETELEIIRPYIAYMPSRPSLYPDLSINEHLNFFKELYGLNEKDFKEKKSELLKISRLEDFKSRKAGELSGGMYKKLGLMCALLRSPSVLLLDEPTNGVDPISRRELWELLYRLGEEKVLILISTSYMDEAERCSRVHFIEKGKIFESGIPDEILAREKIKDFSELFIREARP